MKPVGALEISRRCDPCGARLVVGNLLEVWINQAPTATDWINFSNHFRESVERAPTQLFICGDYRHLKEVTPVVAQALLDGYKIVNPKLDRAALLVPRHRPMVRLQIERLVREAKHPSRRICADPADVRAWLRSRLNSAEQDRLDQFLTSIGHS